MRAAVRPGSDQFSAVRETLADSLRSGSDVGASVAIYLDGEPVVDLWGGYADRERTHPWQRDTLTNVWSTTKTMTALCALVLADRDELDLCAPVTKYWPEFGVAGKNRIEIRHLLSHTAGLPDWDQPMTLDDLCDWEKSTALLARQSPRWEPGTASGYHRFTHGFLLGEVVRRICQQSIGTFFAEQLAAPLDADFHIGLASEDDHRVSEVIPAPGPAPAANPRTAIPVGAYVTAQDTWSTQWRRAEIPAAAGYGNARSVAAVQSVLTSGGHTHPSPMLSEATRRAVFDEQSHGIDLVLGIPLRFGIGYALSSDDAPVSTANFRTCYWGGRGGSLVVNDLDARMTIAYVMNQMTHLGLTDPRGQKLLQAAYKSLNPSRPVVWE
ncbi:serine hydrolase domain-containing protein [Streptomyces aureoverticillatus]|uniref:serine hydrolase domain-containing protein n=1 Tax=Streptomyces aureoverticillatus TaxID=66871 RepID=UPI0013D9553A|nr:serine hydrolase domain-containing protein [Streptomyces aureoverticillatus]QIB48379.1 beta-lactamase family protein [Streptomyces aureoverticillatus]